LSNLYDIEPDEGEAAKLRVKDKDGLYYLAYLSKRPIFIRGMKVLVTGYKKREPLGYAPGNYADIVITRID
jgi:hypothetical protein